MGLNTSVRLDSTSVRLGRHACVLPVFQPTLLPVCLEGPRRRPREIHWPSVVRAGEAQRRRFRNTGVTTRIAATQPTVLLMLQSPDMVDNGCEGEAARSFLQPDGNQAGQGSTRRCARLFVSRRFGAKFGSSKIDKGPLEPRPHQQSNCRVRAIKAEVTG